MRCSRCDARYEDPVLDQRDPVGDFKMVSLCPSCQDHKKRLLSQMLATGAIPSTGEVRRD